MLDWHTIIDFVVLHANTMRHLRSQRRNEAILGVIAARNVSGKQQCNTTVQCFLCSSVLRRKVVPHRGSFVCWLQICLNIFHE